ncbi:putative toxin-antitoxin system toxin component, PIN family [Adlercreutzia sp. ZJ473]|uniref:PIN domain-containing protein n=1 Tax=Adlercreutzia sp. ZJ473 TaxID=2722822 RepID=UPI0015516A99|nr:PIN domain-containing protein [Adlercreutzia sp. ZJ473]
MVNVVIDTNVLVASLIKRNGPNRQALRKILDPATPLRLCYSSQMVDEYADVLHRPLVSSRGLVPQADALLRLVLDVGEEVVPKYIPAIVFPDEKDRPFLEAVVYVSGVLLTNNLKDFPFLGVTVIGPEDFLGWCAEAGV